MVACFLFRLKNPKTKTPHTYLSQPHGGYCLRVMTSLMYYLVLLPSIMKFSDGLQPQRLGRLFLH
jgi:hypothetical protein